MGSVDMLKLLNLQGGKYNKKLWLMSVLLNTRLDLAKYSSSGEDCGYV